MNHTSLTVIIPCKNELPNIEACVNSVREIADEIIVADSGSTDGTLELVQSFNDCRVIEREFVYPADFKNWAIPQATHEWILLLDADEQASPELAEEIRQMKQSTLSETSLSAYWIARSNYFMGKHVRFSGWQGDGVVRLFRRECRYEPVEVHEEIDMSAISVGRLENRLMHNTYRSFAHYLEKMQRYTTWGANKAYARGRRFRWTDLALRPAFRFFRHYILKGGLFDGRVGLTISYLSAFSVFLKYSKLWELEYNMKSKQKDSKQHALPRKAA